MNAPESRNEAILQAIINDTEYTDPPQSRIESLLIDLLDKLEGGDGTAGETFELAETITVSESGVSSIERTGYDYKKVLVRCRVAAGEGGTIQTVIGGFNCGWWAENTSGGVADTFAQIINGMFFSEYGSQMTANAGNNTTLARRETSWGQFITGNITSVKITSSKSFPTGTVIEIYGV